MRNLTLCLLLLVSDAAAGSKYGERETKTGKKEMVDVPRIKRRC
jgi:hypothetical protein